jgi:hypothetical protein
MKRTKWLAGILMAGTLVLAGCSKSDKASPQQSRPDLPKLKQAFPQPTQELNDSFKKEYDQSLAECDKLAANPSLTEAQKKAVGEFVEQVKKAASAKPTQ